MKFSFILAFLVLWLLTSSFWLPACGQVSADSKPNRLIVSVVEEPPQFPGGIDNLAHYIKKNLHYPKAARKAKLEGHVVVNFTVTDEGRIEDVQYLNSLGLGTDQEAMRLVESMPTWIPGKKNGKAVNVRHNVPVNFTLR